MSDESVWYTVYWLTKEKPFPDYPDHYEYLNFCDKSSVSVEEKRNELLKDKKIVWISGIEREDMPAGCYQEIVDKDKKIKELESKCPASEFEKETRRLLIDFIKDFVKTYCTDDVSLSSIHFEERWDNKILELNTNKEIKDG